MNAYIELVKEYPIYSAMIQFAILGTLGDVNEPLLAEAIAQITTTDRPLNRSDANGNLRFIEIKKPISALEQDMYID